MNKKNIDREKQKSKEKGEKNCFFETMEKTIIIREAFKR